VLHKSEPDDFGHILMLTFSFDVIYLLNLHFGCSVIYNTSVNYDERELLCLSLCRGRCVTVPKNEFSEKKLK